MMRLATVLTAIFALALPVVSASGHGESQLAASLIDREVVVTGHAERDPAVHVERPSGTLVQHCPECVLDKRQFTSAAETRPLAGLLQSGVGASEGQPQRCRSASARQRLPRAPPLA